MFAFLAGIALGAVLARKRVRRTVRQSLNRLADKVREVIDEENPTTEGR